jgi:hypothetical protein
MLDQQNRRTGRREPHPVPISLRMSVSTKAKLDQILDSRPRSVAMNDLLLEAIDLYIDQQDDMLGSRQHFNRTLQARLNSLETHLTQMMMLIMFMMANGFALITQGDISGKRPQQAANSGFYIKSGVQDGQKLAEQLRAIQQSLENNKE